jgi:hypothetical protein
MLLSSIKVAATLIALHSSAARAVVFDIPSAIKTSLIEADDQFTFAGSCVETHPQLNLDEDLQNRQGRYLNALHRTTGIWGSGWRGDDFPDDIEARPVCNKQNVTKALASVDLALNRHAEAFKNETQELNHGAWLGPLKLCRNTVAKSDIAVDDDRGGKILKITLREEAKTKIAELTRRSVGFHLSLRVSGSVFMEPRIWEPIESGELQLSSADEVNMKLAGAEMRNAC